MSRRFGRNQRRRMRDDAAAQRVVLEERIGSLQATVRHFRAKLTQPPVAERFDITKPMSLRQDALLGIEVLQRYSEGVGPFVANDASRMIVTMRQLLLLEQSKQRLLAGLHRIIEVRTDRSDNIWAGAEKCRVIARSLIAAEEPGHLELPDGLRRHEGQVQFQCTSCERWTELPVEVAEYEPDGINLCGGSPRCCP